jgi:curved DNA-binding protein
MDYYSILGVGKHATPEEIKKAYRKLASQHHPDKGGDTAKFQQIQEAYSVLSDMEKKLQYDRPDTPSNNFNQPTWEHFFSDFFSRNFNQNTKPIYRTVITITLQEAYYGCNKAVQFQTQYNQNVLNIKIPKGIKNHEKLRYEKAINQSDLIVDFHVLPDLKFERMDDALHCSLSISVLDLIIGTNVEFVTIDNKKLYINIKPGTQPNSTIKIAGKGMPITNSDMYGDQYLLIKPYIPDNIHSDIIDAITKHKTK